MRERYEFVGEIGRGGFGTVFIGRHHSEGGFVRPVALKVLHEDADPEASARLRDEARMMALLSHRAIVGVSDLRRIEGRWTVVMEYVPGATVTALIKRWGAVPVKVGLEVIAEVASALDHAWNALGPEGQPLHLVHRDVKPANVMVTEAGRVKLLDFGIARVELASREARTEDARFGSAPFMAPERWEGTERPEGDTYSLGVTLFRMLTERSFGRARDEALSHEHLVNLRLGAMVFREHPQIGALLRCMLAHDAAARPMPSEVATVALELAATLPGPDLATWAAQKVVECMPTPRPVAPGASASSSYRSIGLALTGLALLALAVPVVAGVGWFAAVWGDPASSIEGTEQPRAPEVLPEPADISSTSQGSPSSVPSAPTPVLEAPVLEAPVLEAPVLEPSTPPGPEVLASPRELAPTPSAEPVRFSIRLTGAARDVVLEGAAGSFPVPGEVPAGRYRVLGDFEGGPLVAGQVFVDGPGNLDCVGGFNICRFFID